MKYTTPVAELVALEAVSVILTSGAEETDAPSCPNETETEWD